MPNLQILSLAIGDMLYIVMRIPADVVYYADIEWPFGDFFCKLCCCILYISQGVSVLTLTALSGERYFAITKPMQFRKINVVRTTIGMIIIIWSLSCVTSVPVMLMAKVDEQWQTCSMVTLSRPYRSFILTMFITLFIIPLGCISVFYILTARSLLNSASAGKLKRTGTNLSEGGRQNHLVNTRTRLTVIILIAVILFTCCWTPYFVYELWTEFDPYLPYTDAMVTFMYVHYIMPMLASTINPVLLFIMSTHFRREFKRQFCCCTRKQQVKNNTDNTRITLRRNDADGKDWVNVAL